MEQKYKKGDRVKTRIGHWIMQSKKDDNVSPRWKHLGETKEGWHMYDMNPELTEDVATVDYSYHEMHGNKSREPDSHSYALIFDKRGWIAWFDENNLIPA